LAAFGDIGCVGVGDGGDAGAGSDDAGFTDLQG